MTPSCDAVHISTHILHDVRRAVPGTGMRLYVNHGVGTLHPFDVSELLKNHGDVLDKLPPSAEIRFYGISVESDAPVYIPVGTDMEAVYVGKTIPVVGPPSDHRYAPLEVWTVIPQR